MDTFGSNCSRPRPCEIVCIYAIIREVRCDSLLVFDLCTCQEILVCTPNARFFCEGVKVNIRYNGEMSDTTPPVIDAICVTRVSPHVQGC